MESEGKFHMGDWKQAEQVARSAVLGRATPTNANDVNKQNGDIAMNGTNATSGIAETCVLRVMREALEARVIKDGSWQQE